MVHATNATTPSTSNTTANSSMSYSPPAAKPLQGASSFTKVQAQVAPHLMAGALSGPSFALEVACQQPTALVAASAQASARNALVQAFHGPALRV